MTKREWQERESQDRRLAAIGIFGRDAGRLRKISATLRRFSEIQCCVEMSEKAERRLEKRIETREATAREIVHEAWADLQRAGDFHGFDPDKGPKVYFQGDPRGCALYVIPPEVLERYKGHSVDSIYNNGIAVYS